MLSGMNTDGVQRDERFPIEGTAEAWIEFRYPGRERPLCCRVIDVSIAGISFLLDEELPLLARGAKIDGALVRLRDRTLNGGFVVKHVTRVRHSETICGAVLYPETDDDMNELVAVIRTVDAGAA